MIYNARVALPFKVNHSCGVSLWWGCAAVFSDTWIHIQDIWSGVYLPLQGLVDLWEYGFGYIRTVISDCVSLFIAPIIMC